jgi:carboxymethylenebutenolidase
MTDRVRGQIAELAESYRQGRLNRRDFIRAVVGLTGSLAAAAGVLEPLGLTPADAAQVSPDDPDLASGPVQYPGDGVRLGGYLSRPKAAGRHPGVIVIHENRGLTDHIQDVARRFAKEGFAALAPDLLWRGGGTASFAAPGDATKAIGGLTQDGVDRDLRATFDHLRGLDFVVRDRVGVVGFCWGGANALRMPTQVPGVAAAVPFYGRNPSPLELVERIACPLLLIYGEDDPFIMPGVPALEAALKRYGKPYEIKVYPGAKHAFHNDTNADRYSPDAARDAWARTIAFLKRHLAI